jgi:RNA polymerase sigma factor (sigma-70 family)
LATSKKHNADKDSQSEKDVLLAVSTGPLTPLFQDMQLQRSMSLLEKAYSKFDDGTIWSKFKSGDESVFTYIYYKHFAMLCRYGSQFVADKDQVKDHIHDLFIELSDRRAKLSTTTSIKFYLMKSLKNRMLAARKKQTVFLREDYGAKGYDFDISFSIEQTMIHDQDIKERNHNLNKAIQKLSKRQREVVYYFYFEELTMEEIMGLMACGNAKSVQNLLYRAIHCLKEYITIKAIVVFFGLQMI